eukprot:scaffold2093_cov141-Alexandrium_tamarense.AAC.6
MSADIQRAAAGKKPTLVAEQGRRFHADYGFMRASSVNYSRPSKETDRVVKSFDDFLRVHGHAKGGLIRTDQGGELARSIAFRQAMLQRHNFDVTTTSSDSNLASRAEKWNDTLATTTRVLLYSSGLPPKYWSVALRHAVYLNNRRVHAVTKKTPFEAWNGIKPSLKHLKVFGSRVCVAKPGKHYAKLDRGDYRGIFLGYTATDANVIYLDLDTGVVKSSPSATFDEAWYTQSQRPPAAQFLYSLGLQDELPEVTLSPSPSTNAYPPKPNLELPSPKLLSDAIHVPILHHPTPLAWIEIAAAAKTTQPAARWENVLDATTSPLSSIQSILADYEISRNDLAMVYMSPDPYHTAFTESLDTCHLDVAQHPTGGTELRHEADRLILTGTQPGSPAAKLPRWRSRLKHAWLIRVNDQDVHTPDDVSQALLIAQTKGIQTISLLFAHSEIKHGLTNDGLPHVTSIN